MKKSIVKKKGAKDSTADRPIYESGYTTAIAVDTATTLSLTDALKQTDATGLDALQEFAKDKSTIESKILGAYHPEPPKPLINCTNYSDVSDVTWKLM